jgi:hypothetical protein
MGLALICILALLFVGSMAGILAFFIARSTRSRKPKEELWDAEDEGW